jgi:hypothetical protein
MRFGSRLGSIVLSFTALAGEAPRDRAPAMERFTP